MEQQETERMCAFVSRVAALRRHRRIPGSHSWQCSWWKFTAAGTGEQATPRSQSSFYWLWKERMVKLQFV